MHVKNIDIMNNIIDRLIKICGQQYIIAEASEMLPYQRDHTLDYNFPFDILVKPGTTAEVAEVLRVCNSYKIHVTPRGGGSGVTGGCLPVHGGIVLSLERLNKILHIDPVDQYVIAEAGVITKELSRAVEAHGLYFPVMPGSSEISFVGGNVAEDSASPNSYKYGPTSHYVANLEVALPNGEIIWTGANVKKNTTGLNLTQLITGSEGILGIVTKVVYKLIRKPGFEMVLLAGFETEAQAYYAMLHIQRSGVDISILEFIGQKAINLVSSGTNEVYPLVKGGINAHLLITIEGNNEPGLSGELNRLQKIIQQYSNEEISVAQTPAEKQNLWKLRSGIGNALIADGRKYRDIDLVVPVSKLNHYMEYLNLISHQYEVDIVYFGHALDGNLHTMVTMERDREITDDKKIKSALDCIYRYAIEAGGVITGEHGVGILQKEYMHLQFSETYLSLMRSIKYLFDPNGILNYGKVY